mmetsp:Transcript_144865/g.464333  ORF Transcript_144865/g.464333 Transcript_144865/m.464333 type:complete len:96 (+) Transcript_144865:83-370(+)
MPTGCVFFAGLLALVFAGGLPFFAVAESQLDPNEVLLEKTGGAATVVTLRPKVKGVGWLRIRVSDSEASHVSKEPYCILGGTFVPHAPEEASRAG